MTESSKEDTNPNKRCTKCGVVKDLKSFSNNRNTLDGLHPNCKSCKKAYYQANRETILEKKKRYRQVNKELMSERDKRYYESRKEYIKKRMASWRENNKALRNEFQAARRSKKKTNTPKFIRDCPLDKKRRVFTYNLSRLLTETTGIQHHVDHMWPISDGGPHWSGNMHVIPAIDNMSKNDKVNEEIKKTIQEGLEYARQCYERTEVCQVRMDVIRGKP